eukprot:CAMPEP_0179879926 /NCGR_PEP_ID=MMETSP0982-20121206/26485_1 /TAXON_ID=483367 /ORGANISM="non described non described, Strain CCMP 2436" /LENGTH=214 /DNA_ID=CAMNT_0021773427 /DNA_START=119 /DNA_END=764 /DNA_ORIENTATION=-
MPVACGHRAPKSPIVPRRRRRVDVVFPQRIELEVVSALRRGEGIIAEHLQNSRRLEQSPAPRRRHSRIYVLEEEIHVPHRYSDRVYGVGVADEHGEGEQHPGQVGRGELEETEEAHAHAVVAPRPHVHHHEGERRTEELDVEQRPCQRHHRGANEQHVEEVGGAHAEAPLLEQPRVAHQEEHVEEEVEPKRAEVEEVCPQPPELPPVQIARALK